MLAWIIPQLGLMIDMQIIGPNSMLDLNLLVMGHCINVGHGSLWQLHGMVVLLCILLVRRWKLAPLFLFNQGLLSCLSSHTAVTTTSSLLLHNHYHTCTVVYIRRTTIAQMSDRNLFPHTSSNQNNETFEIKQKRNITYLF